MMLLPGQGKWFGSPLVGPLPFGTVLNGTVDYSVTYGPPTGRPKYRRTHKLTVGSNSPIQNLTSSVECIPMDASIERDVVL
jgi:hypothetical protein